MQDQSSYLHLRDEFDYENAFGALRESIDTETTPLRFARALAKIIAQLGDAHAEVKAWLDEPTDRFLPFRLADSASGIVGISADGDELLHADYPRVRSIDGISLENWLQVASRFVAQASPQLIRRESLRELRSIDRIREELELPPSPRITLTLESGDGRASIDKRMDTLNRQLPSGKLKLDDTAYSPAISAT